MDEFREMLARTEDNGVLGVYWFATHPTPVVDWPNACLCKLVKIKAKNEDEEDEERMELTELGKYWISLK